MSSLAACVYQDTTPVIKYLKKLDVIEKKSNFAFVDCIYVINLDERPEKWKRMLELFNHKKIKINRVPAINGWKIPDVVQQELAGSYPIRLRGGQIGCLLSHISVIKDAYERNFNVIWVLEDDVEFVEELNQLSGLLLRLSKIDPDWDIFYTDTDSRTESGEYAFSLSSDFRPNQINYPISYYTERTIIDNDIMKIGQRFGMYSLFISRKGIKKILDYFTHVYLWTAIDIDIHYIPNIREYSVTRDIVTVYSRNISDTEKNFSQPLDYLLK